MFTANGISTGPATQGWPPERKGDTAAAAIIRRLLARREGPTALAVLLALVSLPFVAVSLQEYAYAADLRGVAQLAPSDPARWTAAAGAVLFSGLIAGFVGGRISHNPAGALLTFLLAWCLAIAAAPILPAALGQQVSFGGQLCIDGCSASVSSVDPSSGLSNSVFLFWLGPLVDPEPFLALLLGFAIWYSLIARFGRDDSRPRSQRLVTRPPASIFPVAAPECAESDLAGARYAGVWLRFVALVIDAVILGLAHLMLHETPAAPLVVAIAVFYMPGSWWALGATPGQMVVGVRVVRAKGPGDITLVMTIVRFVVFLLELSIFPFVTVGFAWAAFEARKQAWHDIAARTVVIRTV
jgi:uncharacterized RDD family membrane protein YckC